MADMLLVYLLGCASGLNIAGAYQDLHEGYRPGWLWQLAAATVCAVSAGMLAGWR
jgi:hypothetical protein